jgi:Purine nucleoside permease (NUP)
MKSVFIALVLVAAGAVLAGLFFNPDISSSGWFGSPEKISVILTGFGSRNQDGKWDGETAPFMDAMDQKKDVSIKIPMCQSAYEGYIYKSKVLVAVSGMAKVRTTACLTDILRQYDHGVKEVLVVGIAGMSATQEGTGESAMIGDVCINSLAYDFDLQHYSADQAGITFPGPAFWNQESNFTAQETTGSRSLASELAKAAVQVAWPEAPDIVKDIDALYHQTSRNPRVWGPEECMEVTSDLYWHDIKADVRARELAATFMQQVYGRSVSPADVVVATSMEAVPAGKVVDWWNKANGASVAFAYVRGASNFDRTYLNSDGTPAMGGRESVEILKNAGLSQYAIETASLPVLKLFELRKSN